MPWCSLASSYCSERSSIWGAEKSNNGGNLLFYFLCHKMTGDRNQWDFHFKLFTKYLTMNNIHFNLCTVHCAPYTGHCTLYTRLYNNKLYSVYYSLNTVHCILYIVHLMSHWRLLYTKQYSLVYINRILVVSTIIRRCSAER